MSLVVYFEKEINILTRGDQCFGHLPDFIRCLADEDVCRILSNCVFRSFYKTPVQQNVISSLGRKPIN